MAAAPNANKLSEVRWGRYLPWGEIYQGKALRVALFVSYQMGYEVFRRALDLHRADLIHIAGISTDDVLDEKAKISKQKRSWKYFSRKEQAALQHQVEKLAERNGISCFTGNIKSDQFTKTILPQWNPSTILMYGFGQLIPPAVFNYPEYGMYNFHPSDLANHKHAGADPIGSILRKGELSTITSVHHVNQEFDQGRVIGVSPKMATICSPSEPWLTPQEIFNRLTPIAGEMSTRLLKEILLKRRKLDQFRSAIPASAQSQLTANP